LAIGVVCVFVFLMGAWAWYDTTVKPAIDRDLGTLEPPDATEQAEFERVYGVSTGIRLSDAAWDGRERRTVHVRPAKIKRPVDVYDGADR
jgi:hypothetical protein